jgi:outer membrane protein assembly factor BamB
MARLPAMTFLAFALALVAGMAATATLRASAGENWPGWRGPGARALSDDTGLPVEWSTAKNIRWKTPVPGEGSSSPVRWNDRVFLTSSREEGTLRALHCLDFATGRNLWTREIEDENPEITSSLTGHAAATPVTDGLRVAAFFGNAGIVAYDFSGRQLWRKRFGEFESELGLASSPIFHDGMLIQLCDHDGKFFSTFESFLIALSMQDGSTRWKSGRRGLERSWSTPIVVPAGDERELVVSAQDQLRGYDPASGKLLWQVDATTGWVTPTPVFGHGLIFAQSGKSGPIVAVRPGGRGDVRESHVAWRVETGGPYVCSPLLYGDYLYVHNEGGVLACFHALTGREAYRQRLGGKFIASAVGAEGRLYVTNEAGQTFVVSAGEKFRLLATNALEEVCLASPAIADGDLLVRTQKHLWRIGVERAAPK